MSADLDRKDVELDEGHIDDSDIDPVAERKLIRKLDVSTFPLQRLTPVPHPPPHRDPLPLRLPGPRKHRKCQAARPARHPRRQRRPQV